MDKREKQEWILKYIRNSKFKHVDIFDEEFVNSYIENCNPKRVIMQAWGAYKVREIGRYLSEMYYSKILERGTIPLNYQGDGFPKWCYTYWERGRDRVERDEGRNNI